MIHFLFSVDCLDFGHSYMYWTRYFFYIKYKYIDSSILFFIKHLIFKNCLPVAFELKVSNAFICVFFRI